MTTGPCGLGTSGHKGDSSESGPGGIDSTVGGDSPWSHVPLSHLISLLLSNHVLLLSALCRL